MDDVGERSEPQDEEPPPPVAEGGDGEPPGGPDGEPRHGRTAIEFPIVAVGIVALVVLVGIIGWLISRGDGPSDPGAGPDVTTEPTITVSTPVVSTLAPTAPTSAVPTVITTVAPTTPVTTLLPTTTPTTAATTLSPTTVVATTAPPGTTTPGGTVPATVPGIPPTTAPAVPDPIDDVVDIVPNLAAYPNFLNATEQQAVVAELLATPRHDVSSLTPVATLCVTVQLEAPLRVSGRWELDGRPLASMDARDILAPGFGDCIGNEGDPMESGAYQFVAVDADGDESAAGTFVAGAARVDQRFLNNGGEPVCAILLSPATADFFEAFRFDIPVGGEVSIPIADVAQDVRTLGCGGAGTEPLAEFRFDPSADEARDLID